MADPDTTSIDVSDVFPDVQCPTLYVHRGHDIAVLNFRHTGTAQEHSVKVNISKIFNMLELARKAK